MSKLSKESADLFVGDGEYENIKTEYKPWWWLLPFKRWRRWFADRELAKHE